MKIAIITLYTKELNDFGRYTSINLRNYSNIYGYDFIEYNHTLDINRHPSWSKVKAMNINIDRYDWLVWIDADAVITNKCINIESIIDPNYDIIIAREDCCARSINTGVFILRNSEWTKNYLQLWYNQEQFSNTWPWDQAAFVHLYDNNIDVRNHTKVVRQNVLNSRGTTLAQPNTFTDSGRFQDRDFIVHFFAIQDRTSLKEMAFYKDPYYIKTKEDIPGLLNRLRLFGDGIGIGINKEYAELILEKSYLSKLYLPSDVYSKELYRFINRIIISDATIHNIYTGNLDFVYITHEYINDVIYWFAKIRNGGIIVGNNFLDDGIRNVVTEYFGRIKYNLYVTDEESPIWYVVKDDSTKICRF